MFTGRQGAPERCSALEKKAQNRRSAIALRVFLQTSRPSRQRTPFVSRLLPSRNPRSLSNSNGMHMLLDEHSQTCSAQQRGR
jgi:hypothetical protein